MLLYASPFSIPELATGFGTGQTGRDHIKYSEPPLWARQRQPRIFSGLRPHL